VYVGVCLYIRTHTRTLHVGNSDVSQGVRTKHLEAQENPDGLKLGIFVFVYMYMLHKCIYLLEGGIRSWGKLLFFMNKFFLSKKKSKRCDRNTKKSNPQLFELYRLSITGTKL